jgi:UDP-glucose 4-epimerase
MIPMEVGPRRPGDDAQLVADVSAIAAALDFRAAHSSLEEIIGSAWGVK